MISSKKDPATTKRHAQDHEKHHLEQLDTQDSTPKTPKLQASKLPAKATSLRKILTITAALSSQSSPKLAVVAKDDKPKVTTPHGKPPARPTQTSVAGNIAPSSRQVSQNQNDKRERSSSPHKMNPEIIIPKPAYYINKAPKTPTIIQGANQARPYEPTYTKSIDIFNPRPQEQVFGKLQEQPPRNFHMSSNRLARNKISNLVVPNEQSSQNSLSTIQGDSPMFQLNSKIFSVNKINQTSASKNKFNTTERSSLFKDESFMFCDSGVGDQFDSIMQVNKSSMKKEPFMKTPGRESKTSRDFADQRHNIFFDKSQFGESTIVLNNTSIINPGSTCIKIEESKEIYQIKEEKSSIEVHSFIREKLDSIEESETKPISDKERYVKLMKIFQDTIKKDSNNPFTQIYKRLKTEIENYVNRAEAATLKSIQASLKDTNQYKEKIKELEKIFEQSKKKHAEFEEEKKASKLEISTLKVKCKNELEKNKIFREMATKSKQEVADLQIQNKELTKSISEIVEKLDVLKCRENKMIYLLFLLQNKGYPVIDVYSKELKNISDEMFMTDASDFQLSKCPSSKLLEEHDNKKRNDNELIAQDFKGLFGNTQEPKKNVQVNLDCCFADKLEVQTCSFETTGEYKTQRTPKKEAFDRLKNSLDSIDLSKMEEHPQVQNLQKDSNFYNMEDFMLEDSEAEILKGVVHEMRNSKELK